MAAPVQRRAIAASRQGFTLRQTRRAAPFTFSMMLVRARERHSSVGRPRRLTKDFVEALQGAVPDTRGREP